MSDIIINKVALASDLAYEKLSEIWDDEHKDDGVMLVFDEDGGTTYVPKAQKIFDKHYDYYLTIVERNEFSGTIRA